MKLKNKMLSHSWVAGVLCALVLVPFVGYPLFLMKILCFAMFAMAFNLLIGYVGLLSFGHAMFFGGAAYVSAYSAKTLGLTPELAVLCGTSFAVLIGAIVGYLAIRRQGIYFAMITLALAQMFFFLCLQVPMTGGEDGIQSVPRGRLFGLIDLSDDLRFYYVVAAAFALVFVALGKLARSSFGQALRCIRDNEPRAISLGYKVENYKLAAFIISAGVAGLAGSLKALVFQLASLTDVAWQMSGEAVLMTLVGGLGTLLGPVVGAAVVVSMQNYLAGFGEWVLVMQGVIFLMVVLVFRRGIVGELQALSLAKRFSSPPVHRSADAS